MLESNFRFGWLSISRRFIIATYVHTCTFIRTLLRLLLVAGAAGVFCLFAIVYKSTQFTQTELGQ
jgi:phage-related holin